MLKAYLVLLYLMVVVPTIGLELLSMEAASDLLYSTEKLDSNRIYWNLHFTQEEQLWITTLNSTTDNLYSCFVINARECACFQKNFLVEENLFFPTECSIRSNPVPRDFHLFPSHLWFSIALHRGNYSLASSPLRVAAKEVKENEEGAEEGELTSKGNKRKRKKHRHHNDIRGGTSHFLHTDITLVLPITLVDASRVLILFTSLKTIHPPHNIHELLVFTPTYQHSLMEDLLAQISKSLSFPVKVLSESMLYHRPISKWRHANYAIQMSIKLLAARFIETAYYLTLDSDVILLHHKLLQKAVKSFDVIPNNPIAPQSENLQKKRRERREGTYYKGVYNSDPAHSKWWMNSQSLLQLDETQVNTKLFTFGVTPVLLSTWGSLMTLSLVEKSLLTQEVLEANEISSSCYERENRYFDLRILPKEKLSKGDCHNYENITRLIDHAVEKIWLESFNYKFWTEYTLYRISLEYFKVFETIHFKGNGVCNLHCYDIWLKTHHPWDAYHALRNQTCVFSVVQSSKGISTNTLYKQCMEGLASSKEFI